MYPFLGASGLGQPAEKTIKIQTNKIEIVECVCLPNQGEKIRFKYSMIPIVQVASIQ